MRLATSSGLLEPDQSPARGRRNGFRATQHFQFREDVPQVALYREFADVKFGADFLITLAVGERLQNLGLTISQRLAVDAIYKLLHQRLWHGGLAAVHLANAIEQFFAPGILQQI